jgi:spore coat polysaccharide biosynthesis predicted glycosyltransferase SpsG
MRKLFFRADADKSIGFGHFSRSLALADMLKDRFECTFFTQTPTDYQKAEVERVCKLVALPSDDSKFDSFLDYLTGDEIVFLDNYFFTSNYQLRIKKKGSKLICLGTNDRHYYCDVLINYAESCPEIFSVEPYTSIKLGMDWVILRKPFRNISPTNEKRDFHRIVICYGGTDQFGLTEKTMDVIKGLGKLYTVSLIATDGFGKNRLDSLKKDGADCYVNATAEEIVELFKQSDCLVSSASTITHEGLACQIPVLCGYYVENQKRMYQYFSEKQLVIGLGNMLSPDFPLMFSEALSHFDQCLKDVRPYLYGNIEQRYVSLINSL